MNLLGKKRGNCGTFEDLSISEMVNVQGSGDVTPETTVPCSLFASLASGIQLVRTIKGHC